MNWDLGNLKELYTSKHTFKSSYSMTQTFEQASASSALNESSAKCLHVSFLSSSIFFFETEEECMYIGK